MSYIDLTALKAYLDITNSSDDTLLTDCITAAQKAIDNYAGRSFEAASDTTRYLSIADTLNAPDAQGYRTLDIPFDLCAITSVTNGDGTTISANDYFTQPRNSTPYYALVIRRGASIAWTYEDDPEDAIAIVGRWAYSTTAPDDVKHACKRLAAYLFKQRDNMDDLDRPVASTDGMMLLPGGLPKDVKQLLSAYRKRVG